MSWIVSWSGKPPVDVLIPGIEKLDPGSMSHRRFFRKPEALAFAFGLSREAKGRDITLHHPDTNTHIEFSVETVSSDRVSA